MFRLLLIVLILIGLYTGIPAAAQNLVPGLEFLGLQEGAEIGDILAQLYIFGVAMAATAAFIMLVIGGVQYMLAGDRDPGPAKERIRNALWGLALALSSWLILNIINQDLLKKVNLKPIEIIRLSDPSATTPPPGGFPTQPTGQFKPPGPAQPLEGNKCSPGYKFIPNPGTPDVGMCYAFQTNPPCIPPDFYTIGTQKICTLIK